MTRLEFWPDYGAGPLWTAEGRPADLESLGLPLELVERVRSWNSRFEEDKLPIYGPGDALWTAEGVALLHSLRSVLGHDVDVVVTEPWWGETPL